MPYQDEIQKRIAPFAEDGNDLSQEAAIARSLLQESLLSGGQGLCVALLNTIPKIVDAQQRRGSPVGKPCFPQRPC